MSGERFQNRVGEQTDGARHDDDRFGGCLTEAAIQGLADGTLRGGERFLAEEHLSMCPRCWAELAVFEGLVERLNKLADPPLPADFTLGVMAAVELREQVRDDRQKAVLAALPAALIAIGVLLFWAFANGAQRVRDLVVGATLAQKVADSAMLVLEAVRVPLALTSMVFLVGVLAVLARAMGRLRSPTVAGS